MEFAANGAEGTDVFRSGHSNAGRQRRLRHRMAMKTCAAGDAEYMAGLAAQSFEDPASRSWFS